MDDRRLATIAMRQCGVVRTAQLLACGLSRSGIRHRVATGRLFPVARGAYALDPCPGAWRSMWAAVLRVAPQSAVLSHWSAAFANGFADHPPPRHHVMVPASGRRAVAGLVIHHTRSLRSTDVVTVRGLRVTSPARTILDIAGRAEDHVVRRLIREAEFQGVLPAGAMSAVVAERGGHPGVGRIRRVDPRTAEAALRQTPFEDDLERLIATTALPAPIRQQEVDVGLEKRYRVDFAWPDLRLIAEADGRAAHVREAAFHEDRRRDGDLGAAGWLPMRFTRVQILGTPDHVRRQLLGAARHRGWSGLPGRRLP